MIENFKAAIFDMDGTILDSMSAWENLADNYLIKRNIQPEPNLKDRIFSFTLEEATEYYKNNYNINDSTEKIMNDINSMIEDNYKFTVPLKGNILTVLNTLRKRNIKMCVATATDRSLAMSAFERLNIKDYFCGFLTCSELGVSKGIPLIYEKSLDVLGSQKCDTLVFEDAIHAINTAKHAGFRTVGIYDQTENSTWADICKISDYTIKNWDEFLKLIN